MNAQEVTCVVSHQPYTWKYFFHFEQIRITKIWFFAHKYLIKGNPFFTYCTLKNTEYFNITSTRSLSYLECRTKIVKSNQLFMLRSFENLPTVVNNDVSQNSVVQKVCPMQYRLCLKLYSLSPGHINCMVCAAVLRPETVLNYI